MLALEVPTAFVHIKQFNCDQQSSDLNVESNEEHLMLIPKLACRHLPTRLRFKQQRSVLKLFSVLHFTVELTNIERCWIDRAFNYGCHSTTEYIRESISCVNGGLRLRPRFSPQQFARSLILFSLFVRASV